MRSYVQLINLFLLPLAVSASESVAKDQLESFADPLKTTDFSAVRVLNTGLLSNRQSCPGGYCEGDCMEVGGTCCNDGNGYCKAGYYCTATACCKKGSTCSGTAPPPVTVPNFTVPTFSAALPSSTGSSTGTCLTTQAVCDDGCMTLGNTCCNDGTGSCKPGFYCTATACCPIGGTCDEPPSDPNGTLTGGGATPTKSSTSRPATTSTGGGSFTFGTLSLTDDVQGLASTTSSRTSTRTTTGAAGTTAAPPPPPLGFPGAAGGQLEPNAKLAAGFVGAVAGAAAMLF
ncbi:hypothetical protein MN608_09515 [Microdochium nivale]|nr:hypothetical protein MN608_09515 [Microdochium nivale]